MKYFFKLNILLLAGLMCIDGEEFDGIWLEDQRRRSGVENFLKAFGLVPTNTTILPNYNMTQDIHYDGGIYNICGTDAGGHEYEIMLYTCTGETKIHNFGIFGGISKYRSVMKDGAIYMETFPRNMSKKFISIRRIWISHGLTMMEHNYIHAQSGVMATGFYNQRLT